MWWSWIFHFFKSTTWKKESSTINWWKWGHLIRMSLVSPSSSASCQISKKSGVQTCVNCKNLPQQTSRCSRSHGHKHADSKQPVLARLTRDLCELPVAAVLSCNNSPRCERIMCTWIHTHEGSGGNSSVLGVSSWFCSGAETEECEQRLAARSTLWLC